MKRPYTPRKATVRTGDIKRDLSQGQLAGIGAVAVAYNYAEAVIDKMLTQVTGVRGDIGVHLMSRINGVDGKIELIKMKAVELNLADDVRRGLSEALGEGGFKLIKGYRDAIIHARVLDSNLELGEVILKRGRRHEILLSEKALFILYDTISLLTKELVDLQSILSIAYFKDHPPAPGDLERAQLERAIQENFVRSQQHRTSRLSLQPLPEFPGEHTVIRLRVPAQEGQD